MTLKNNQKALPSLDDKSLLELRVRVEKEMASRNLSLDVGEIGEQFAINYFNSTRSHPNLIEAPKGAKNVDALSRDGERYSIKTRMKAKKTGTIYPDNKNPDKQLFEHLLVVSLDPSYQLASIYSFTWVQFLEARAWDKRMSAWYVPISNKRLQYAEKIFPLVES
jgi:hypothetical protein